MPKKKFPALHSDEIAKILHLAYSQPQQSFIKIRNYTIMFFGLHTGLRNSEIRSIKTFDIDLKSRVLKVDQGKGGKDREVVITDDMYSALSRYSSFRDKIMSTSSLLFCSTRGMKLHCADFHIIFRKISSEMGKRFTPHDLRRTYASTLSRLGVPPFMIQLQMGHTDIRTTMHYVTHNIDDAKKAICGLSLSG